MAAFIVTMADGRTRTLLQFSLPSLFAGARSLPSFHPFATPSTFSFPRKQSEIKRILLHTRPARVYPSVTKGGACKALVLEQEIFHTGRGASSTNLCRIRCASCPSCCTLRKRPAPLLVRSALCWSLPCLRSPQCARPAVHVPIHI